MCIRDRVETDRASACLKYDAKDYRRDETCRYMEEIHQMAVSGKPIIEALSLIHI